MKSSQLFEIIMQRRKKEATKCTIKSLQFFFSFLGLEQLQVAWKHPLGCISRRHVNSWTCTSSFGACLIILLPRISIASKGLRHILTDLAMLHFDERCEWCSGVEPMVLGTVAQPSKGLGLCANTGLIEESGARLAGKWCDWNPICEGTRSVHVESRSWSRSLQRRGQNVGDNER